MRISYLILGMAIACFPAMAFCQSNNIHYINLNSTCIEQKRNICIYLPSSYNNTAEYPVIYVLNQRITIPFFAKKEQS